MTREEDIQAFNGLFKCHLKTWKCQLQNIVSLTNEWIVL